MDALKMVVKEKKRVGKGNHNHGEIWKPDKICYMMEHVKDHVYEKDEAHLIDWSEFKEKKFSSGPYANTTKASMRNMYMRTVTSAKCIFKKDKRGIYPSRVAPSSVVVSSRSRTFSSTLMVRRWICTTRKRFMISAMVSSKIGSLKTQGRRPHLASAMALLVRETQNTKHEVFGHRHTFRLHTWSI